MPESNSSDARPPTDAQIRIATVQALDAMRQHSVALTTHTTEVAEIVAKLHARVSGTEAVASVVDDNEEQVQRDRDVAAQKEVIGYLMKESHSYVTVVIAGAFAAYFTTLGVVSERLSDPQLRISALLMTLSVSVFALWEILSISHTGYLVMRGRLGAAQVVPRWIQIGWPIALAVSLIFALPAIGLSVYAYARGLAGEVWP